MATTKPAEPLGTAEWYKLWIHGRPMGDCITLEHAIAEAKTWARCTRWGVNIRHSSGTWQVWPSGTVERLR